MIMKNEKGYALLITIFAIVIISIIGLGLISVTANSNQTTVHERQNQSLYYVSEAGINLLKTDIVQQFNQILEKAKNDVNKLETKQQTLENYINAFNNHLPSLFCFNSTQTSCGDNFVIEYNSFGMQNGKKPKANVSANFKCPDIEMKCKLILTSIGSVEGDARNKRTVEQVIEIDKTKILNKSQNSSSEQKEINALDFLKDFAIFSTGTIDFSKTYTKKEKDKEKTIENESEIDGSIGSTLESESDYISLNEDILDDIKSKYNDTKLVDVSRYKGIDLNQLLPKFPESPIEKKPIINMFPSYNDTVKNSAQSVNIKSKKIDIRNYQYAKIDTINSTEDSLEIELKDGKEHTLFVDNLNVKKTIDVSGDGILNLVIGKEFTLDGSIDEHISDDPKINVIYDGKNTLNFNYSISKIEGNLFVRNSNVYVSKRLTIDGDYIHLNGNLTTNLESNTEKEASIKIKGNIYMDNGSLDLGNWSTVQNLYLNNVDVIVKKLVNIYGDFYVNQGNVTVVGTVDIDGNFMLNHGDFTIGKVEDINNSGVISNAYIEGDTYIGTGNLFANKYIDLEGNLYYKGDGVLSFKDRSEIDELKGRLVLAPNGKVSLQDNSKINGTIVAKQVEGYGDATVKYDDIGEYNAYLKDIIIKIDQYEFAKLNHFMVESPLIER